MRCIFSKMTITKFTKTKQKQKQKEEQNRKIEEKINRPINYGIY
jgi:hypothetical protein